MEIANWRIKIKRLIIPDLHIGLIYDGLDRTDDIFELLYKVYETEKDELNEIIWLGDIFDHPNISHTYVSDFIKLLNKFYASSFCNHIILLGNHDGQITTKKGSPLEEIEASGLAQIKWEPSFDEKNNILYLPYTLHKDKLDQFTTIPDNLRTYTHLDIAGTIKGIEMEIGKGINSLLPEYIIKKSNKIYAGHIHKAQKINNIHVVGSLLKVNISESNNLNHYVREINDKPEAVFLKQRKLLHFDLDITEEGQYNKLESIKTSDIQDSILSIKAFCNHNIVHKYDFKQFESDLRKKVKHLRFKLDVIKEKKLRMKELDSKQSDFDIINKYLQIQGITDKEIISNMTKEIIQ